jgi:hypothetical protein
MGGIHQERVGNAQRAVVLDLLSRALEEGYLDLAEYEVRMAGVTEAKSVPTLFGLVADLPPQFRWDPHQPLPKSRQERERETADSASLVALILGAVSIPAAVCIGAGFFVGIAALYFGRRGLRAGGSQPKAVAGLVLGVVGMALSLIFVAIVIFAPEPATPSGS